MRKSEVLNIINSKKVPYDELDDNKYFGFFPAIGLCLTGIPLLPFVDSSVNPIISWIGFVIGVLFVLFTYIQFKIEKNIKSIKTNLSKESNEFLIDDYLKKRKIALNKYKHYSTAFLPALLYKRGLKLILLYDEGNVYFNIRRIGFVGRIPYSIGKIIEEKRLIRELKKRAK
ncbi:MAG: hypothetical protein ABJL44_11985 [Algibacter sp.]